MPNWVYNQIELQNREDTEKIAKYIRSKDRDFDFNNVIKMPEILAKTSASSITILAMAYCIIGDHETKDLKQWRKQLDLFLDENVPNVAIQFLDDDETKNITGRIIDKVEPIITTGDIKELIYNHERLMEKRNDINKTSFSPNAFKAQGVTAWKAILTTGFRDWYGWSINNWDTKWNAVDSEISITNCTVIWRTAWNPSESVIKQLAKDVPVNMYYTWFEEPRSTWAGSALFHNGECIARTDTESAADYIPIFVYMDGDSGDELHISDDDEILYPGDEGYGQAKPDSQKMLPNYDKFLSLN